MDRREAEEEENERQWEIEIVVEIAAYFILSVS